MIDPAVVEAFESALDPAAAPRGYEVLAYGEISAVITLDGHDAVVLKRMSGFRDGAEVEAYTAVVRDYLAVLAARDIPAVRTDIVAVGTTVYLVQPRVERGRLGHQVLQDGDRNAVLALLQAVYDTVAAAYDANDTVLGVAVDAQLSNWSWDGATLGYVDVGTPFLRRDGVEQLDFAVLFRALPQPLRWIAWRFLAPGVIDRYYQLDQAITDILANFVKEGRSDLIGPAVAFTNAWGAARGLRFDERQVHRYYDNDARIWAFALAARRIGRFVDTRLLGRRYDYLLPGPIRRR